MTNHETPAIDRIPITRSVSYAVRDAPELPAHGATIPGTTLAPTQITFTYQAAPDSQLGRIQARVKGFWMRDGGRVNPGQPMAQHYFDGLTDWPEWLAEEARLHDPEAAVSVPPPAPRADDRADLRQRIADTVTPFLANFSDEEAARANAGEVADAVLAVLPPTADRAAVIAATARACAEHLRDTYSDMWTADAARSLELHAARIERGEPTALLHRMADKAQQQPDTETQPATCAECDHPHATHREGDDPVSPGQCSACPDDDAWHDYQADEWPGGGSR